jgi:putative transcriptional regulator
MSLDSLQGMLLIASPAIFDPNFRRTVVLVTAHMEEGALGLVLNRRSDTSVGEAVPQLVGLAGDDEAIYVGGPVSPDGVSVLAEFEDPADAGVEVVDDIGFVALDAALDDVLPAVRRLRVFAGVASWGSEQLENELAGDDWIVEAARADDVFTPRPESLWERILERKGGRYALVARMPLDPSLN